MESPNCRQSFSAGTLYHCDGSASSATQARLVTTAKGLFAHLHWTWRFDTTAAPTGTSLFLLHKPWGACLSRVSVDGGDLKLEDQHLAKGELPSALFEKLEEQLVGAPEEILVLTVQEADDAVLIEVEFSIAMEFIWHCGHLEFRNQLGSTQLDLEGNWELQGLAGAQLEVSHNQQAVRLETYDDQRHRWSTRVTCEEGDKVRMRLKLDERSPASLAYFAPPEDGSEGPGCAAVAVVAPVRPQLGRPPVHLAFLLELRNPQDSLVARSLLESMSGLLTGSDRVSVFCTGANGLRPLLTSGTVEQMTQDLLAGLFEPADCGQSQALDSDLLRVTTEVPTCTHLVVAVSGGRVLLGGSPTAENIWSSTSPPVFIFPLGRSLDREGLERLACSTSGFVAARTVGAEGVEEFRDRVQVRLSPPLLKDFKLEGWGLDEIVPPLLTQVFCDEPTLLLGRYDGLLPKTVTLSGYSHAGKKLAQRVRVEIVRNLPLEALFRKRRKVWSQVDRVDLEIWTSDSQRRALVLGHKGQLDASFFASQTTSDSEEIDGVQSGILGDQRDMGDIVSPHDGEVELFEEVVDDFFDSAEDLFSEESSLFTQSQEASLDSFLQRQEGKGDVLEDGHEDSVFSPEEAALEEVVEPWGPLQSSDLGGSGGNESQEDSPSELAVGHPLPPVADEDADLVRFATIDDTSSEELFEGPAMGSSQPWEEEDLFEGVDSDGDEESLRLDSTTEQELPNPLDESPSLENGSSSVPDADLAPRSGPLTEAVRSSKENQDSESLSWPNQSDTVDEATSVLQPFSDEVELFDGPSSEISSPSSNEAQDSLTYTGGRADPPQLSESFSAVMTPPLEVVDDWKPGGGKSEHRDNIFDFSRFEGEPKQRVDEANKGLEEETPSHIALASTEGDSDQQLGEGLKVVSPFVPDSLKRAFEVLSSTELSDQLEADHLALALSCLGDEFQKDFLSRLSEWQGRILESQIAWARELEIEEREAALRSAAEQLGV